MQLENNVPSILTGVHMELNNIVFQRLALHQLVKYTAFCTIITHCGKTSLFSAVYILLANPDLLLMLSI